MHNIRTIYAKEVASYFKSPMAYIFLVSFVLLNGYFFSNTFFLINQSDMRALFNIVPLVYLFFCPVVTMGLIAHENSTGTSERVVNVWHRRTDLEARDFVQTTDAGLVTVKDTRLLVRASTGPWVEGDVITDDRGETRTIEGVSEVGTRGLYLESLARLIR